MSAIDECIDEVGLDIDASHVPDARRELKALRRSAAIITPVRTIASSLRDAGLLQQATAIEDALAEAERKVAT